MYSITFQTTGMHRKCTDLHTQSPRQYSRTFLGPFQDLSSFPSFDVTVSGNIHKMLIFYTGQQGAKKGKYFYAVDAL
jgi:hypothetical protein